jgi:hypothetical protein
VVWKKSTDVSEDSNTSIFRVGEKVKQAFKVYICLAYSSFLKMEALYSSETSINFHQTAQNRISQDNNTVTCTGVRVTNNNCSRSDVWIY